MLKTTGQVILSHFVSFCLKSCCHGNKGQSVTNIDDTVKLADHENHTLEENGKWIR